MSETSTPPPSSPLFALVRRLLVISVLASVAVGIWWIVTGTLNPAAARVFLNGLGLGLFGVFGLGAAHAGRTAPSFFARIGPLAAVAGAALWLTGVWFDAWEGELWWRVLGVCFFVAFGGLRGAWMAAGNVDARAKAFRSMGQGAVAISMALGVMLCLWGLGSFGWRLFGVTVLVEMAMAVALLAHRAVGSSSASGSSGSSSSSSGGSGGSGA
jgi:hypothetical protein